jgi:hypothetical protein
MRICLLLDRSRILRWQVWLADALSERSGCEVFLDPTQTTTNPLPRSLELVRAMERLLYGLQGESATDRVDRTSYARHQLADASTRAQFDVVLDLVGNRQQSSADERILTPLFNSVPGEAGALLAVLDDDKPLRVELRDSAASSETLTAQPAMTDRRVLTRALDNVLSCTIQLILKAVDLRPQPAGPQNPTRPQQRPSPSEVEVLAAVPRTLAVKAQRFLRTLMQGGNTWAIAWRLDSSQSLLDLPSAHFRILPDDRQRYYADPFPYCRDGERFLFVEEFPFSTQRGCISVAKLGPDGTFSNPRPIIEEPHHLSYPFVFEFDGQVWMIPESGAAGRVDLYRAEHFPYRWTYEGPLLSGITGYDATLLRQNDRFWMFITAGGWKASTWDNLCVFHAERFTGPWRPHATNPVLLDAALSRSAGHFIQRDGGTLRFAQDCSRIYGGAISVCRLETLSDDVFTQKLVGRIETNLPGCHTYNRHMDLEVIDVFGAIHDVGSVTGRYRPHSSPTNRTGMDGHTQPPAIAPQPN